MSETVTGLLKSIADTMQPRIVPDVVDDQRDTREGAEDTEAESPAAGDVRPPVLAQVYARQADRSGQQDARGHERGPTCQAAQEPGRDDREHDVDRRIGGMAARVRGAGRARELV